MQQKIRNFRDLDAWRLAMDLADVCYGLAKRLPKEEQFGLAQQLRRASVSVPSNVAEGYSTGSDGLLARHLAVALGSAGEADTLLELIVRNSFLPPAIVAQASDHVTRTRQILHGLARSVRARRLKRTSTDIVTVVLLSAVSFVQPHRWLHSAYPRRLPRPA